MYTLVSVLVLNPGTYLILFDDTFKNDNFDKLINDFENQSKSYNFEFDTHIFYKLGILGNTCTFLIPVDAATIINKFGYSAKLKHAISSNSKLPVK